MNRKLGYQPSGYEQTELGVYTYISATTTDVVGDKRRILTTTLWYQQETCTVANTTKGGGTWVVDYAEKLISLSDNNEGTESATTSIDLATGKSGYGIVTFGDGLGYANFIFTTAGVVTLINMSANVFTSLQTGTNHVIIKDNGTNVRITNELGATTIFNVKIFYTN